MKKYLIIIILIIITICYCFFNKSNFNYIDTKTIDFNEVEEQVYKELSQNSNYNFKTNDNIDTFLDKYFININRKEIDEMLVIEAEEQEGLSVLMFRLKDNANVKLFKKGLSFRIDKLLLKYQDNLPMNLAILKTVSYEEQNYIYSICMENDDLQRTITNCIEKIILE